MDEVECKYISEEERTRIYDDYKKIMERNSYEPINVWKKRGENFCQFSVFSNKDFELTTIQNNLR